MPVMEITTNALYTSNEPAGKNAVKVHRMLIERKKI